MARVSWVAMFAVIGMVACARERRPPPPAPQVYRPADTIPGDLDAVIRIDIGRIRARLGEQIMDSVRARMQLASDDPPGERLLYDALDRADTVWLAFRPGPDFAPTDNVVVLRGAFSDIRPRHYAGAAPWGPPVDLGGDWRRLDREAPKRSAPARVYFRSTDLVVVCSEAEIDSVERSIELQRGDPHVDPPDRGAVAVEVRLPTIANVTAGRVPRLAALLAQGRKLRGSADLDASGLDVEVEALFGVAADAEALADLTRDLLQRYQAGGPIARLLATRVKVSVSDATAVATLRLNDAELAVFSKLLGKSAEP